MNIAIILAALGIVLCVIFFIYLHWYINRKTSAETFLAEYRIEVGKLAAEIDAAADRDLLLVEERMKALRKLLEDADRRIAVYVREMERRPSSTVTQSQPAKKPAALIQPAEPPPPELRTETPPAPSPEPTPVPPVAPATPLYTNLGRGGRSNAGSGDRLGLRIVNVTEPEPSPAVAADNAVNAGGGTNAVSSGEKKELRVQIAELAAAGLSPAEIVSQLGVSYDEVTLALRTRKKNTA